MAVGQVSGRSGRRGEVAGSGPVRMWCAPAAGPHESTTPRSASSSRTGRSRWSPTPTARPWSSIAPKRGPPAPRRSPSWAHSRLALDQRLPDRVRRAQSVPCDRDLAAMGNRTATGEAPARQVRPEGPVTEPDVHVRLEKRRDGAMAPPRRSARTGVHRGPRPCSGAPGRQPTTAADRRCERWGRPRHRIDACQCPARDLLELRTRSDRTGVRVLPRDRSPGPGVTHGTGFAAA